MTPAAVQAIVLAWLEESSAASGGRFVLAMIVDQTQLPTEAVQTALNALIGARKVNVQSHPIPGSKRRGFTYRSNQ